jgi:hypothetical protein
MCVLWRHSLNCSRSVNGMSCSCSFAASRTGRSLSNCTSRCAQPSGTVQASDGSSGSRRVPGSSTSRSRTASFSWGRGLHAIPVNPRRSRRVMRLRSTARPLRSELDRERPVRALAKRTTARSLSVRRRAASTTRPSSASSSSSLAQGIASGVIASASTYYGSHDRSLVSADRHATLVTIQRRADVDPLLAVVERNDGRLALEVRRCRVLADGRQRLWAWLRMSIAHLGLVGDPSRPEPPFRSRSRLTDGDERCCGVRRHEPPRIAGRR